MTHQYSIAQARDRFTRIVQEAEAGESIQITRRGKPVAVVLSQDAYQHLTSTQIPFGSNLDSFRTTYQIEELEIDPDPIFDSRDHTSGREVNL